MSHFKYEIATNLPKILFSFIASFVICYFVLGNMFYMPYILIFTNSLNPVYFISSEMFFFFISAFVSFIVQSSVYSIIYCFTDIWMIDEDYEKNKYMIEDSFISKEMFMKLKVLKHIPIFSLLNTFVYLLSGKSILDRKYKIVYSFDKELSENKDWNLLDKSFRKFWVLLTMLIFMQFIGCVFMYVADDELKMDRYLENIDTIKSVNGNILLDNKDNESIYNLVVYLEDGYIHYNKLTYAKEEIKNQLEKTSDFIKSKYALRGKEISGFNIVIYNEYTKTWDKYMYSEDLNDSYPMENISDNIYDIDIYVRDDALVYNIMTNLSRNEIGWDMAEFILNEFENDINNKEINDKIQKILKDDTDIKKYVINILSKEYFKSKNHSYFVYIKDINDKDWFYYDNEFYNLRKRELDFESAVKDYINNISFDFKDLYETGEVNIITKKDIDLTDIYDILDNSKEGEKLKEQVKYIGKKQTIKFVIKEGIS